MQILENKHVTKRFGNLVAVDDLSFEVEDGEIFGIAGPNGAGKTTLFNLIAGTYSCSGEIIFNGDVINRLRPHRICQKGIARTFQTPLVFSSLTVFQNVETGAHFGQRGVKHKKQIIENTLEFVGLKDQETAEASQLSLFNKKKTMLAAVLATKPQLLLLDEPAGGLNPKEIEESITLFKRINDELGITIIVIEHLMKVLMDVSKRMMILNNGKKVCIGTARDVAKDEMVINIYLGTEDAQS